MLRQSIIVSRSRIPNLSSRASILVEKSITRSIHSNANANDKLRQVFDDANFFKKFNNTDQIGLGYFSRSSSRNSSNDKDHSPSKSGLFNNSYLTSPKGLLKFSQKSLKQANELVDIMVDPQINATLEGKLNFIKTIDQLSDTLCRVIDVAEFIRVAHPSQKWIQAAQQTHEHMFEFMNQLNTNVPLYQNLLLVLQDESVTKKLSIEELKVGDYLAKDFERSGIDLDSQKRQNFVEITQEISLLGSHFNNGVQMLKNYWCEVTKEEYESIPTNLQKLITRHQLKNGKVFAGKTSPQVIPLAGEIPYTVLTTCENEQLRKKIWIALHSATNEQLDLLNGFLKYRTILAKMLGFKSFSQYQLEHKMAKTPENVMTFLANLQQSLQSGVVKELKELTQASPDASPLEIISSIKPWDRDYLLAKAQNSKTSSKPMANISPYLSVGTIVSGLSSLFTSLYNISLVPQPTHSTETWDHSQVRKVAVMDNESNEPLGYLYLDFWSPKVLPSHFTIVCSRELNARESAEEMDREAHLDASKSYQLPVISLLCNFQSSQSTNLGRFAGVESSTPTLLSLDQVDTIFHEMGHAMHSMIGRTKLHNLAGTRCSTDFVELPSVLMEFFSKDPRVLTKIARHYETNEPLDPELLAAHQHQRVQLDDCETYIQSKMAMLDQVLHSEDMVPYVASGREIDSTHIYHSLEQQLQVFADQWSTWHGKFPHLFSYGSVYYSYLLDRAIAEKVWNGLFKDDPWSRKAGETYKQSILKWGGTKDPWECLADALGDEGLRKGDERAMEIIGRKD
ncbi:mitochondrial intermediate peptidase [[Candida] anglica]|uniref:Mitochondrial intermediate peptidase n=1 Tax=[Candida] anglica TaxID=148631 RepID=A0ABP0EJC5_9ASCO